jgi:hypothetical protein
VVGDVDEDLLAVADHAHELRDLGGRPVLGDEAGSAGSARRTRRDAAGAGHQQHARCRRLRAQALADLRTGLQSQEQVDERHMRLVAPAHGDRLRACTRAETAIHPRHLAEHQPKAPVHDIVVVDHEHS